MNRTEARRWVDRAAAMAILLAVVQFIIVVAVAVVRYPGGSYFDPGSAAYSWRLNTLSDLGYAVAHNGQPNRMAGAYNASLVALFLSLVPLWLRLPGFFAERVRLAAMVRALGLLSVVGGLLVGVLPAGTGHTVAIGLGSVPGLAGLVLGIAGLACGRRWWLAGMGAVLLAVGLVHFSQYVAHFWLGGPWTPAAPAVQKLAAACCLLWMSAVAIVLLKRN